MNYHTDALQHEPEHKAFLALLRAEGVRSYLEVGSAWGGSLWRTAQVLPNGARLVAVDLPSAEINRRSLEDCVVELNRAGFNAVRIIGNSRDKATIDLVRGLAPFDAVFIDGDHSRAGVLADWQNYGQMARIVAFHDIAHKKVPGVFEVWNENRIGYRHMRIEPKHWGIGVIWREEPVAA